MGLDTSTTVKSDDANSWQASSEPFGNPAVDTPRGHDKTLPQSEAIFHYPSDVVAGNAHRQSYEYVDEQGALVGIHTHQSITDYGASHELFYLTNSSAESHADNPGIRELLPEVDKIDPNGRRLVVVVEGDFAHEDSSKHATDLVDEVHRNLLTQHRVDDDKILLLSDQELDTVSLQNIAEQIGADLVFISRSASTEGKDFPVFSPTMKESVAGNADQDANSEEQSHHVGSDDVSFIEPNNGIAEVEVINTGVHIDPEILKAANRHHARPVILPLRLEPDIDPLRYVANAAELVKRNCGERLERLKERTLIITGDGLDKKVPLDSGLLVSPLDELVQKLGLNAMNAARIDALYAPGDLKRGYDGRIYGSFPNRSPELLRVPARITDLYNVQENTSFPGARVKPKRSELRTVHTTCISKYRRVNEFTLSLHTAVPEGTVVVEGPMSGVVDAFLPDRSGTIPDFMRDRYDLSVLDGQTEQTPPKIRKASEDAYRRIADNYGIPVTHMSSEHGESLVITYFPRANEGPSEQRPSRDGSAATPPLTIFRGDGTILRNGKAINTNKVLAPFYRIDSKEADTETNYKGSELVVSHRPRLEDELPSRFVGFDTSDRLDYLAYRTIENAIRDINNPDNERLRDTLVYRVNPEIDLFSIFPSIKGHLDATGCKNVLFIGDDLDRSKSDVILRPESTLIDKGDVIAPVAQFAADVATQGVRVNTLNALHADDFTVLEGIVCTRRNLTHTDPDEFEFPVVASTGRLLAELHPQHYISIRTTENGTVTWERIIDTPYRPVIYPHNSLYPRLRVMHAMGRTTPYGRDYTQGGGLNDHTEAALVQTLQDAAHFGIRGRIQLLQLDSAPVFDLASPGQTRIMLAVNGIDLTTGHLTILMEPHPRDIDKNETFDTRSIDQRRVAIHINTESDYALDMMFQQASNETNRVITVVAGPLRKQDGLLELSSSPLTSFAAELGVSWRPLADWALRADRFQPGQYYVPAPVRHFFPEWNHNRLEKKRDKMYFNFPIK